MNKRTIWIITCAMSIALVGLISFQIYWINSTIRLNEDRFNRDVYESLNFVIKQLEKSEILAYTFKAIDSLHEDGFVVPEPPHPPIGKDFSYRRIGISRGIKVFYESNSSSNNRRNDTIYEEIKAEVESHDVDSNIQIEDTELLLVKQYGDTIKYMHQDVKVEEGKVKKKLEIFDAVLDELIQKERNSTRKINLTQIDSLIEIALKNKGIDTKYEFAVWNQKTSNAILAKEEKPSEDFFDTQFKASLFPNDLIGNSEYLMLNFPNQQSFLFNQIWSSLLASFILVAIILSCFGYSLFTIIKQKKISEVKNDFINNITHEFKTPIATVALACEALLEQEILDNPMTLKRYLGMIKEENHRLENHVEKVLQLATLDKETLNLQLKQLDIHHIIEKVIKAFDMQIKHKKGSLVRKLSANKRQILADNDHITNVISNLLDNAIKYSPEAPAITIISKNDDKNVSISITDKGIGMSKDELKKVFDKFYRVSTGNVHNVKGFGLGLSYVNDIMEMHHGSISATSDVRQGSVFTLTLPLVT